MNKEREPASGATEGARRATGGAPEERRDGRGRWSAKRKTAAILRLLRGEDSETLSREWGVTAARLSGWRDRFLASGPAGLQARETDVVDEETQWLKSLGADLRMSNELRREKIHPDGIGEVAAMSCAISLSTGRVYGLARVAREEELARSSFYHLFGPAKER